MNLPVQRRLEKAVTFYLSSRWQENPSLANVPLVEGRSSGIRVLPCVIVYAEQAVPVDDFPAATGVYEITLKVFNLTQADDEDVRTHDQRSSALAGLLLDKATVLSFVNKPDTDPDKREVQGLHFYDLIDGGMEEGRDERHHGDVFIFQAICQDSDPL